jgi:hypothetical protein
MFYEIEANNPEHCVSATRATTFWPHRQAATVQHLEQQPSRLRIVFSDRFEACPCVHGRQLIVVPKFGTKRSWVQIPPPRRRSEAYCNLG